MFQCVDSIFPTIFLSFVNSVEFADLTKANTGRTGWSKFVALYKPCRLVEGENPWVRAGIHTFLLAVRHCLHAIRTFFLGRGSSLGAPLGGPPSLLGAMVRRCEDIIRRNDTVIFSSLLFSFLKPGATLRWGSNIFVTQTGVTKRQAIPSAPMQPEY